MKTYLCGICFSSNEVLAVSTPHNSVKFSFEIMHISPLNQTTRCRLKRSRRFIAAGVEHKAYID